MKWTISSGYYPVWEDFSIELKKELIYSTGHCYQLEGSNGSGKSSFIKKVLIPFLQQNPGLQYILYIEQQIQSQFDAIKAYAALQKPQVQINTFQEMIDYQFELLHQKVLQESRPCILILDECLLMPNIINQLAKSDKDNYCLIVVSHKICNLGFKTDTEVVKFHAKNDKLSRVSL